jgi:phosphate transport system permease protein
MTDREHNTGIAVDAAEVKHARKRYRAERRFRMYGIAAIAAAAGMLALLVISIVATGWTAFYQHSIALDVTFEAKVIDPKGGRDPAVLARADYQTRAGLTARTVPGCEEARR